MANGTETVNKVTDVKPSPMDQCIKAVIIVGQHAVTEHSSPTPMRFTKVAGLRDINMERESGRAPTERDMLANGNWVSFMDSGCTRMQSKISILEASKME